MTKQSWNDSIAQVQSPWWKPAHRTYSGCSVPGVGTINRAMQLVKESACLISKMISLPQRNYWQKQKATLQKFPDKIPTSLGSSGDLHKRDAYPPPCRETLSALWQAPRIEVAQWGWRLIFTQNHTRNRLGKTSINWNMQSSLAKEFKTLEETRVRNNAGCERSYNTDPT